MYEPVSGAVWFYWPVTVAVVAAMNVRHLVRRRALRSATLGVLAAAHLTVAVVVLLAGAASGLVGERPRSAW